MQLLLSETICLQLSRFLPTVRNINVCSHLEVSHPRLSVFFHDIWKRVSPLRASKIDCVHWIVRPPALDLREQKVGRRRLELAQLLSH